MTIFTTTERPPWTPVDMQALLIFLGTPSGQRLLGRLMHSRPEYKQTFTSIEERAITSAKVEGFELALEEMLSLTNKHDNG